MEDIPISLTAQDISVYVHDALKNQELGNLNGLAKAAGDLFSVGVDHMSLHRWQCRQAGHRTPERASGSLPKWE